MAVPTLLTRIILDNKKFRAQLNQTGKTAARDFKRNAMIAVAGATILTAGIGRAHDRFAKVANASALAAAQFGKSVDLMARRSGALKALGVGKDAEEVASAFDLLSRMGVRDMNMAQGLMYKFQKLADATGGDLLPTIGDVGGSLLELGKPLSSVSELSDAFTFVARKTTVGVSDFTAFLQDNSETLRQQGMTVQDAAAALYLLEGQGKRGTEAISVLSGAIQESAHFTELFSERTGFSRSALETLSVTLRTADAETTTYSNSLRGAHDGWQALGGAMDQGKLIIGQATAEVGNAIATVLGLRDAALDVGEGGKQGFAMFSHESAMGLAFFKQQLEEMLGFVDNWRGPVSDYLSAPWEEAKKSAAGYLELAMIGVDLEKYEFAGYATNERSGEFEPMWNQKVITPEPKKQPKEEEIALPPVVIHKGGESGGSSGESAPSDGLTSVQRDAMSRDWSNHPMNWMQNFRGFSDGGIVLDDGPAMLHGPEAVVPLDRLGGLIADGLNQSRRATVTRDAVSAPGGGGGSGGGVTIILNNPVINDGRDLLAMARTRGLGI